VPWTASNAAYNAAYEDDSGESTAAAGRVRYLEAQVADLSDELDGYRSAASEMAAELEVKTQEVLAVSSKLRHEQGEGRTLARAEEREVGRSRLERAEAALERERTAWGLLRGCTRPTLNRQNESARLDEHSP
jgi:hypothetical protein